MPIVTCVASFNLIILTATITTTVIAIYLTIITITTIIYHYNLKCNIHYHWHYNCHFNYNTNMNTLLITTIVTTKHHYSCSNNNWYLVWARIVESVSTKVYIFAFSLPMFRIGACLYINQVVMWSSDFDSDNVVSGVTMWNLMYPSGNYRYLSNSLLHQGHNKDIQNNVQVIGRKYYISWTTLFHRHNNKPKQSTRGF